MVRLGDIFTISSGGTPDKRQTKYYKTGTIPWVKTGDLKEKYVSHNTERITQEGLRNSSAKLFPAGTVLVAMYGATIGACSILDFESSTNQACAAFLPASKVLPDYLYYFLQSKKDIFVQSGVGGAQPNISVGYLKGFPFDVISIESQRKIVSALDSVSTLISLRRQQLAKLDELVRARFMEMFSACTQKDMLGNIVSISRGASPRPISAYVTEDMDGVNWIKIGDVPENSLYIERTKEKITLEGAKKSRYVYKGDFILSNSMSFGRPYILNIDGCVHDGWLIISDYLAAFHPLYLYYAIRDFEVQNQFCEKATGATVKNLNSDLVKSTLIKVPPMELQHEFSESALKIEQTKSTIRQGLDKLEILKKSLMQEYFG